MPHRVKYDANHSDVAGFYRSLGCTVADTARAGLGVPDLFVGCMGVTDPVEVKTAEGTLTASQETFVATWRGSAPRIVRTLDEVIAHVAEMRQRGRANTRMIGPERDEK